MEFAHSLRVDVSSPKTCTSGKPATLNCACVCVSVDVVVVVVNDDDEHQCVGSSWLLRV